MRVTRLLLLVALLGSPVPATAATSVPALGATTVVRASRAVSIDVRIVRTASASTPVNDTPAVSVRGGGRFVAVALVGTDTATKAITLVGGAFADPAGKSTFLMPVSPIWGASSYEFDKDYPDDVTLPAGRYRLYVVPDGKAATVTLRLHGLTGTVSLVPTRPLAALLAFPAPRLLGANGLSKNVYSAGTTVHPAGRSVLFHGLWYDTSAHAAGHVFLCHGAPTMEPVAFQPACAALGQGEDMNNDRAPTAARDVKMHLHAFGPMPPGDYSMGFWYITESVVTDLRYVTVDIPV